MTLAAMAADYTDSLAIYINGATTPVTTPATISVDQASNGTYTFTLKNFTLSMGGQTMYIGNVQLDNVFSFNGTNGRTILAGGKDVEIQSGDDASKSWIGPMMGDVSVILRGYQVDNRFFANLDIEVESMNMAIRCVFGRGFSLINGGFETYHTASVSMEGNTATSDEPDGWHSFMSASGDPTLVYLAGYNPHTFISDLVRPGSNGKHSLMLTSVDMWIAIANGTVTTGRINTGSMTADDLSNHAWLSLDSTGTDAKGDPFYQYMNGRPDSLALWVKFKQGTPNADHPYATVSAIITDGTYYQDPKGDDLYNDNVMAVARNNRIESNNNEWQRISIPFDYASYDNATGRAILATISTNADPGAGSTDTLYVDDAELIYRNYVNSVSFNGEKRDLVFDEDHDCEVSFNAQGKQVQPGDIQFDVAPHSVILAEVDDEEDEPCIDFAIMSDDLSSYYTIEVTLTGADLTAIKSVKGATKVTTPAVYNISGQRVSSMQKGQVYILRNADGTTKKILK